jgi:hypothetical protein
MVGHRPKPPGVATAAALGTVVDAEVAVDLVAAAVMEAIVTTLRLSLSLVLKH